MVELIVRNVWLIPFLPLLGGIISLIGGERLRGWNHAPVVGGIALSLLLAIILLLGVEEPAQTVVYQWLDLAASGLSAQPSLQVPIELRVDQLTTMMLGMVTFVSLLVAIFAAGYMAGDAGYPRFFFIFGMFVFAMTGLVLSSNFVLTYVFWEGVGVCSYLLIGHYYFKPSAAHAAKKAFLVNRVGDFGFTIALFWLWYELGSLGVGYSLSYDNVLNPGVLAQMSDQAKVGIPLLLLWAAAAKSAQIPLYVWLPDAMEGPTPVSALIHAATMVTAGVYLIARSSLLFAEAPGVQLTVAVVGCATAFLAAAIALTQYDLKRVLAYSTVSQLGFMFMGLGAAVGKIAQFAIIAAVFHLFTHAFFKALLFLGSGSVMHAMGNVIDMRRFRGLRHRLPITFWTFLIGSLTLAGLPPLSGFFSKDEILAALKVAAVETPLEGGGGVYTAIYWVATITAFLTAFYTGRALFLTFFGPEKLPSPDDAEVEPKPQMPPESGPAFGVDTPAPETSELSRYEQAMHVRRAVPQPTPPAQEHTEHDHSHDHGDHFGHESPPIMTVPLIVLAVCAILVGLIFGPITHAFAHYVEETPTYGLLGHEAHAFDWVTATVSTIVALLGLGLAWVMYGKPTTIPERLASTFGPLYRASYHKFRVDELYEILIVAPTRGLATLAKYFDIYIIDGLVRLTAFVPRYVGREALGPFQNGLIQVYAAGTVLGLAFLLLVLLFI